MKSLIEFINESKGVFSQPGRQLELEIPVIEWDGFCKIEDKIWKTLTFPKAKYVVFKDFYRHGDVHFATFDDMIENICFKQDDYESFNPKNHILMYGNDYKKLIGKMFKKYTDIDITKYKSFTEFTNNVKDAYDSNVCDNLEVLAEFYFGEQEPKFHDFSSVRELMEQY